MKLGTKSLLIGAHQILWHPVTVTLAWIELYGLPNWKELVCICIHDWGYCGCQDIDGIEGENHPWLAAHIADYLLDGRTGLIQDESYSLLCLSHSRDMAKKMKQPPSKLCWADKLSVKFDPWWLYLPRVILSGEIKEFRILAEKLGEVPNSASNKEWYLWAQERMIRKAYSMDTRPAYEKGS